MEETKATLYLSRNLPNSSHVQYLQEKIRNSINIKAVVNYFSQCVQISTTKLVTDLESFNIVLSEKEVELIEKRCSLSLGVLDATKIIQFIDIGIPSNYIDLDLWHNQLPQPYRMISKILETEIIDRSWLEIIRLHPEARDSITGSSVIGRQNVNFEKECFPSSLLDRPHIIASCVECNNYLLLVSFNGTVQVLDNKSGKIVNTVQFLESEVDSTTTRVIASGCIFSSSRNEARLIVTCITKIIVETAVEEVVVKGKGSKAAAPVESAKPLITTTYSAAVYVIDFKEVLHGSLVLAKVSSAFKFTIESMSCFVDISQDGLTLVVNSGSKIHFFVLSSLETDAIIASKNSKLNKKMSNIDENVIMEEEEGHANSPAAEKGSGVNMTEKSQTEWNVGEILSKQISDLDRIESLDSMDILSCHTFPFNAKLIWEFDQYNNSSNPPVGLGPTPSITSSAAKEFNNGILVIPINIPRVYVFGLRCSVNISNTAALENEINEKRHQFTYSLELVSFWDLSNPVSALDFEGPERSIVSLGLENGSMALLHLKSLLLTYAPVKHFSAISSIAFSEGSSGHIVTTGSTDGTLCFSRLNGIINGKISSENAFLTASLIGFRNDFEHQCISKIWSIKGISLIVVLVGGGGGGAVHQVLYDAESFEMLGRCGLTSGIPGLKLEYAACRNCDVYKGMGGDSAGTDANTAPTTTTTSIAQRIRDEVTVATASRYGFYCYYFITGKSAVVASFNISTIIKKLCPGVHKVLKCDKYRDASEIGVFRTLSPLDRVNANLDVHKVSVGLEFSSSLANNESPQNSNPLLRNSSNQSIGEKKVSRGSNKNRLSATTLTEEKLHNLQKSFSPFSGPAPLPSMTDYVTGKMLTPQQYFASSVRSSQLDRPKRTSNVLERMTNVASMC